MSPQIKIINKLGIVACILAVLSCFMPWVTFPAQQETFTGFYVKKFPSGVYYGKPGTFITILCSIILLFMFLPKLWAKRINIFLSAFFVAFVVSVYIRFTNSLFDNEIEKRFGLLVLVVSSLLIFISCMLPDMKMKDKKPNEVPA
jgi:uncharacterized membrane protein